MQKQKSNRPFEMYYFLSTNINILNFYMLRTSYVSSFMNMFSNQEPVEVADVMVQQKFNNCIRYLATDGKL
jgi:predicted adenine nucleotide alpha hydrolase (AANH) superfamily ATPase